MFKKKRKAADVLQHEATTDVRAYMRVVRANAFFHGRGW